MKDYGVPTTVISIPTAKNSSTASAAATLLKKEHSETAFLFGKTRYKFWVLAAIVLLAVWSMFTGSVTLKWSAGNLTRVTDNLDIPTYDDLDILEVEEKEKVVRYLWDVYTQSRGSTKLPRFWQEAFEAAYESLASDVASVREAAISEIAKMSIHSFNVDPHPLESKADSNQMRKSSKLKQKSLEV